MSREYKIRVDKETYDIFQEEMRKQFLSGSITTQNHLPSIFPERTKEEKLDNLRKSIRL